MVENTILTRGTMIKIIFKSPSRPFAELSSKLKMLKESTNKNAVYASIILFRRISMITYLIIFFILTV